jgi:hypothetical protein
MPKYKAAAIEDNIVRILRRRARCRSAECGKNSSVARDADVSGIERGDDYLPAALIARLAGAAFTQILFP